ncbi:MAG: glycine cleavage system aminomethyltransferase GcvT [Dehalococcoidia bacterium]|nr:glycine cleavage system aminomethyltransferase GcvT [Dehalococcoidia bacterium]
MGDEKDLRKSPLENLHRRMGARMTVFAGWEMPLQFKGIVEEHRAVRWAAGIFDVSHLGRLFVTGPDAESLLRRAFTFDVARLGHGRGHYALLCREDGGIIDDLFVFRLEEGRYLVAGNAANADRDRDQIARLVEAGMTVRLDDRQAQTVMLAVQGPQARGRLSEALGRDLIERLPRRGCTEFELLGTKAFVSRSGYTGEDGFELITSVTAGRALWEGLVAGGMQPCGLGARDTLRLEAALLLHGADIDTSTDPFEAGLEWVVDLGGDRWFVGKEALLRRRERGPERRLVCLRAATGGIMRAGHAILRDSEVVGALTSGGFSPTLGVSIGMGYVPVALSEEGTRLDVDVRGKRLAAEVVGRPFYRRPQ